MPTPVIQTANGYVFHAPMRIVISAANPLKPGMPIDAAARLQKRRRRRALPGSDSLRKARQVARVRAPVDHASGDSEQECRDNAVRKHLQHRTGNAEPLAVAKPSSTKPMWLTLE